jgi:6-phosphogluconate dehydrogenase
MSEQGQTLGVIGLGEMGRNLVLNIADHGLSVIVYNRTADKTKAFMAVEAGPRPITAAYDLPALLKGLCKPRAILMMISAGLAVDETILELLPLLEPGDLLVDGGNSFYLDTDRREKMMSEKGFLYLGMGISGGSAGARNGPSLMPGGPPSAYEGLRPILETIAAKVNGTPCVAYMGPGSAGHYVKMVHNGIEYGLMQLIAEAYHLLKQGLNLSNDELSAIFNRWNQKDLQSYLLEITSRIFLQEDMLSKGRLIDRILDQAGQKGTGMWTTTSALELGIPVPNIDLAEMMRDLSGYAVERRAMKSLFQEPPRIFRGERNVFINQLGQALYGAVLITYGQGFALLKKASESFKYGLDLAEVARIWRGGCIIRAALLEKIVAAFRHRSELIHLLADPDLAEEVKACHQIMRQVIKTAVDLAVPLPGLMASLIYFDSFRSSWLPANLIQAQRDYFGAHTYRRADVEGIFHTDWEQDGGAI